MAFMPPEDMGLVIAGIVTAGGSSIDTINQQLLEFSLWAGAIKTCIQLHKCCLINYKIILIFVALQSNIKFDSQQYNMIVNRNLAGQL